MDEYISKQAILKHLNDCKEDPLFDADMARVCFAIGIFIENMKAADVQLVGRCKDCMYFKPAHVRCADGSEKAYSEFPEEAFEPNFGLGVTNEYGINVGSQCVYDEWCGGYIDDKTVFRKEDDFCSRFKSGARIDLKDGDSKC